MGANPNPKNIPFNFTKLNKYNELKLFVLELMKKDLKNDESCKIEDRIPEYLKFSLDVAEKNSNKVGFFFQIDIKKA